MSGILNALLESQYSVEIVMEHHLDGERLREYPLIVIPEWEYLEESLRQDLLSYVKDGGNLLLIGPKTAALFERELDAKLEGEAQAKWLEHDGWLAGQHGLVQAATLGATAKPFGKLYASDDLAAESQVAGAIAPYGAGKIAAAFTDLGRCYRLQRTAVARKFLNALVRELFPHPMVEIEGSQCVDVAINRINGKLAINLVNTAGPHHSRNVCTYDEIPPIGPLQVSIRMDKAPSKITTEPEGKALPYDVADGVVRLSLPRLEIHSVIVVE
jgi:hypothetical protein